MKRHPQARNQVSTAGRGVRIAAFIALSCASAAIGNAAGTQFGDAARGAAVAERWCVNCHVVSKTQTSAPKDAVPSFIAIADREALSKSELDRILSAPHGPMPTDALSRQDRADVIAYILSLNTQ